LAGNVPKKSRKGRSFRRGGGTVNAPSTKKKAASFHCIKWEGDGRPSTPHINERRADHGDAEPLISLSQKKKK